MLKPAFSSIDSREIHNFENLADTWWDESGPFKSLHQLNPARIGFIKEHVLAHFQNRPFSHQSLKGLSLLDIGCGGGLLTEPMARLGAFVTGIDATRESITTAQKHAQGQSLEITYKATTAEVLADQKEKYDIVLCMEVVEHVSCVPEFITTCCSLVKPKGLVFFSTINQTIKSFFQAIVAAEYILKWVPQGTHQWRKFVRPRDLKRHLEANGFKLHSLKGLHYEIMRKNWNINNDTEVNYILCASQS